MQFWIDVLNTGLIIAVFAVSLSVLLGAAGQLSIAPAGLGGVGGYVAGYLSVYHHVDFLPALIAGTAAAGVLGLALGFPALRLGADYVILLTLAFATVVVAVFEAIPALGGTDGLFGLKAAAPFGSPLLSPSSFLPLVAIVAAACFAFCWRLNSSPFGRVLRGIREDSDATAAVGKNTVAFKILTFAWTGAVMGAGGVMLVYYQQIASPAQFSFDVTTTMVAAVVIGGMGNLLGAFVGALLLEAIGPLLEKVVKVSPTTASLWQAIIYGLILVVVMRLRPIGLIPEGVEVRSGSRALARFANHRGGLPGRAAGTPSGSAALGTSAVASTDGSDHGVASDANETDGMLATTGTDQRLDELATEVTLSHTITAHVADHPVEVPHLAMPAHTDGQATGAFAVQAAGLVKSFGGIQAVRGLNIALEEGKVTALVGPNGAGKTTVFNLLTGRIRPDGGSVTLRGRVITHLPPYKVARLGMARTFQDVRTFLRMTVAQNVMLSVPGQSGEKLSELFFRPHRIGRDERQAREGALRCLEFVGLEDRADQLAGGLGFGDQKLLAIARLLATGADILLLDEPASGIDRANLEPVLEVIERLRADGSTICLVEHNLDVVSRLADHVLFMELGRVVAEGTMEQITGQPELAEVYFGSA